MPFAADQAFPAGEPARHPHQVRVIEMPVRTAMQLPPPGPEPARAVTQREVAFITIRTWLGVSNPGFMIGGLAPKAPPPDAARDSSCLSAGVRRFRRDVRYRRIAAQLARQGVAAGTELVGRLMGLLGLAALATCGCRAFWWPASRGRGDRRPASRERPGRSPTW
jgi:hypothetical protein